jgi:hypothetical protein
MSMQLPLTDDAIRAAIVRRATGGTEGDLRERVLAATGVVSQRRSWRVRLGEALALPERRATLTLAVVMLLLLATAVSVALVGRQGEPTTPAPLGALAYVSRGDLYVAGPAGVSPRLAWDVPDGVFLSQPTWIDAETILIERMPGGVYVVDLATTAARLVDDGGELLALSPDHGRIATAHPVADAVYHLWIFDLATGSSTADLGAIASTTPLSWSPDGRWLLGEGLGQASATSGSIYRVDVQTGESRDLATRLCCGLHQPRPALSPDGSRVVFVIYYQATQGEICDFRCGTLWTLDPDTGARDRLTEEAGSEIGPTYSPDGAWIAFMEKVAGAGYDVAIVRPDGTGRRKLTNSGDAFAPPANIEPFRYLAWDGDARGLTFGTRVGEIEFELWHVTLDGVVTRIEAPAVTEFARQVLP